MVVKRHYKRDGTPAYITLWQEREGEPNQFQRLVYPRAPGFATQWARGEDWSQPVLDVNIVPGT